MTTAEPTPARVATVRKQGMLIADIVIAFAHKALHRSLTG